MYISKGLWLRICIIIIIFQINNICYAEDSKSKFNIYNSNNELIFDFKFGKFEEISSNNNFEKLKFFKDESDQKIYFLNGNNHFILDCKLNKYFFLRNLSTTITNKDDICSLFSDQYIVDHENELTLYINRETDELLTKDEMLSFPNSKKAIILFKFIDNSVKYYISIYK